jgi:hypothetical protein
MKDFVKAVAAAYGNGDPHTHEIGTKAMKEIDELRRELQSQSYMIKELLARVPKPPEPRPVTSVTRATADPNDGKLSDEMKNKIRALYLGEYRRQHRWLTAQELVDQMLANGENFGVAQPVPSVGTVLAAARRQHASQGQEA